VAELADAQDLGFCAPRFLSPALSCSPIYKGYLARRTKRVCPYSSFIILAHREVIDKLKIVLGILLALVLCSPTHAQERKALTVPIERKAGLILVSAKVQGIDGTFILDTGAQWTVVSPRLARSATDRRPTDARGVTGTTRAEVARVMIVFGGENFYDSVVVSSMDTLSKELNANIDGVIGMDVLGTYKRITVDLPGKVLVLS
jgi:hypothetical protein